MAKRKLYEINTFGECYAAAWQSQFGVLPITPEQHEQYEREQRAYNRAFNRAAKEWSAKLRVALAKWNTRGTDGSAPNGTPMERVPSQTSTGPKK